MDRIIRIVFYSTLCPLLKMVDDDHGGKLVCPKGTFNQQCIQDHNHTGEWFLAPCDDCTISRPLGSRED